MADMTVNAQPVLVYRPIAAKMLATSEKRVQELVREGYLSERYPDTRARYLVSELEDYAKSLPTDRPEKAA